MVAQRARLLSGYALGLRRRLLLDDLVLPVSERLGEIVRVPSAVRGHFALLVLQVHGELPVAVRHVFLQVGHRIGVVLHVLDAREVA